MPDAEFATVAEVARRLGVSSQTIRRHLALGNLAGLNVSTGLIRAHYRVSESAVNAFTTTRTIHAPEAARE